MLLEQLGRIDLNLLIILQVLLEERNGSRAARRLHLSQSAVSKALGRLRETFDDPLFVRSAYGLEPTARALTLQQQLQPILLSLDNLIQPPDFDPANTEREFVIASMDSAFTLFAPLYLSELKRQAPRIRLRYEEWTENSLTEMDGLEEERRLMYVAITRARRRLYVSFAQSRLLHGQTRYGIKSRFLEELPENAVKWLTPRVAAHGGGGRFGQWHDPGAKAAAPAASVRSQPSHGFRVGQSVRHAKFGEGVVINLEGSGDDARA